MFRVMNQREREQHWRAGELGVRKRWVKARGVDLRSINSSTERDTEVERGRLSLLGCWRLSTLGHYRACQVPSVSANAFPETVHMSASGQRQGNRALGALRHGLERPCPWLGKLWAAGTMEIVLASLPRSRNASARAIQEIIRMYIFIKSYTLMLTPTHTKWTQCKCLSPPADGQTDRTGPMLSRDRALVHVTKWMSLKNMLSER